MMKYNIYADEAWTHTNPPLNRYYNFYGGVLIEESLAHKLECSLKECLSNHNLNAEVKWKKINPVNIKCYKELIDIFCNYLQQDKMIYRQMFCDRSIKYDGQKSFSELKTQFKLYYQFLKHSFEIKNLPIHNKTDIILFLDNHSAQDEKKDLQRFVTNFPLIFERPDLHFKVNFINSKKYIILQVCDLLMGAAGSYGNKKHLDRVGGQRGMTPKQKLRLDLAKYIYNHFRDIDSMKRGTKAFNWFETTGKKRISQNPLPLSIWKFRPKESIVRKEWQNKSLINHGKPSS